MKVNKSVVAGISLLLFVVTGPLLYAQSGVKVLTYYDDKTDLVKEEFTVRDTISNIYEGPYTSYFSNGRVEKQGDFRNSVQHGHWKFYYENGNLRMDGDYRDGQVVGVWRYYYEKKQTLSAQGILFNNQKQEAWEEYYESGQAKNEGKYLDGKKVGIWNYYYEDGTLKAQAFYEAGRGIYEEYYTSGKVKARGLNVDGMSDSTWQFFFESGELQSEGGYANGVRNGKWQFFYDNGQVMAEGDYQDGQANGKWNYYYEDGTLNSEGALQSGKREGFWKIYDRSGTYKAEGVFQDGEGEYREYYESGKLRAIGNIKDDRNEGQWQYYYETGELEGECFFVDGRGEYIGYYPDSTIKTRGQIEDGKWIGEWQLFAEDGTLEAYYRPVYPDEIPLFSVAAATPPPTPTRRGDYDKPDYGFRPSRFNYFKPASNEFVGITVASNPLMLVLGYVPLSLELFYEERLGYELEAGYKQERPFIFSTNQYPRTVGGYLSVRQKFYHQDRWWGMPYFGHEIRSTFLSFSDSANSDPQSGWRLEYYVLGGSRFTTLTEIRGFTVDVFGGLGIGFEQIPGDFQQERWYPQGLSLNPWLGINLGWMFSARAKNQRPNTSF